MESEHIPTRIIRIGNSQGVRIPKAILALSGIEDNAEMSVEDGAIIIRPLKQVRAGWEASFAAMNAAGDDNLLDNETTTTWDEEEWQWS